METTVNWNFRSFATLVAICLLAPATEAETPRDTLIIASAFDDIISFDPAEGFEVSSNEINGNTYARLIRNSSSDPAKLVADVASQWSVSADGKVFTFQVRPGLKFASGNSLTAEDVVYSLRRAVTLNKAPAFILTQLGWSKDNAADKIRQTGPLTLALETDKAYSPEFVYNCLTANIASVLDKKTLQANEVAGDWGSAWLKTHHAGSGPFKLREWRANELVALDRNEYYVGAGKAKLARIVYRHVKEAATQRLLLTKGDIDVARNLSPEDLDTLRGNKELQITWTPRGEVYYLALNQKNPILAKPEVREAMKWLVDYSAIGATLIKNIGVVQQNFIPGGMLGANTEKPYSLNVAKAKALLAKAGVPQGFKVTLDMRTIQPLQGISEAIQQSAKSAGIDIELIPGDGKQTLTKYRARSHDIYIGRWGADYWDPHSFADTFARNPDPSEEAKFKTLAWRNAWNIPEMTRAADAALLERDPKKRKAMYEAIQAEFRKTSPFVVLYQRIDVAALRSNVSNFAIGATSNSTNLAVVGK
jgi:peptide/nickel transport system substrate-binding protein